jgi:hypothetical protein
MKHRSLRTVIASAVAIVISAVGVGAAATAAPDSVLQAQGTVGQSAPGLVRCYYANGAGRLTVGALGPLVLAYDRFQGSGNDWQQVRYRIVFYSALSGQPIEYSGWSGFVWAGDNVGQAAIWSGVTVENFAYSSRIAVGTQIEFYNRDGRYEGFVTHYQDGVGTYQNYQEGNKAGVSNDQCVTAYGLYRPYG